MRARVAGGANESGRKGGLSAWVVRIKHTGFRREQFQKFELNFQTYFNYSNSNVVGVRALNFLAALFDLPSIIEICVIFDSNLIYRE